MAERSNAAVLKTVEPQGSGGSNPSSSAKKSYQIVPKSIILFRVMDFLLLELVDFECFEAEEGSNPCFWLISSKTTS